MGFILKIYVFLSLVWVTDDRLDDFALAGDRRTIKKFLRGLALDPASIRLLQIFAGELGLFFHEFLLVDWFVVNRLANFRVDWLHHSQRALFVGLVQVVLSFLLAEVW